MQTFSILVCYPTGQSYRREWCTRSMLWPNETERASQSIGRIWNASSKIEMDVTSRAFLWAFARRYYPCKSLLVSHSQHFRSTVVSSLVSSSSRHFLEKRLGRESNDICYGFIHSFRARPTVGQSLESRSSRRGWEWFHLRGLPTAAVSFSFCFHAAVG